MEQRIINEGFTTRFHDLARLELTAAGGRPGVSIFRSAPRSMPITLSLMERHVKSSQTFVPLDSKPYIVAVAAAGDLMPGAISVFVARPDQGVNYHAGTWHHYSLALGEQSNFSSLIALLKMKTAMRSCLQRMNRSRWICQTSYDGTSTSSLSYQLQ